LFFGGGFSSVVRFPGDPKRSQEPSKLKALRHLLVALFFLGLTALEIGHGIFRLNTVRHERHREILAGLERGLNDLARDFRLKLEEEREHAGYLSRLPAVRRLLKAGGQEGDAAAEALEADLLPYLVSFRGIDRVRILDPTGCERFRCERIGKGVGALPKGLLETEPDTAMVALARDARMGEVVLSDLGVDSQRVEVPESERQVLHFATVVAEGEARLGILVLTVYAAPLLNSVRNFPKVPGVQAHLIARDGSYLASTLRSRELDAPEPSTLRRDYPEAAEQVLSGVERARSGDTTILALSTGEVTAPWRLLATIPDAALDAASSDLSGEYAWIVGSMALVTVVLVSAGAFLVRMSIREFRLGELARYERQQKELERQMQIAERLGSLGLLTAGVAHEINNPLEGIENYLELLQRDGIPAERRRRYVELVRYGFRRIRDIVRDLSAFARPGVGSSAANLREVIEHSLRMVGYTKDFRGIAVSAPAMEPPPVIAGDPGRLEQVFINLFLNAARAMRGAGEIRVEARTLAAGANGASQVEVTVDDTGPGIPEDALGKIFDPFFTTTDGTGLGLSVSYGIVRAHGGTISAENRPSGGARFTLRLPAAEPAVVARPEERREERRAS
jgi:signal transduction histidine kinase